MNTIKEIALFEPLVDVVPDTQPITEFVLHFRRHVWEE